MQLSVEHLVDLLIVKHSSQTMHKNGSDRLLAKSHPPRARPREKLPH